MLNVCDIRLKFNKSVNFSVFRLFSATSFAKKVLLVRKTLTVKIKFRYVNVVSVLLGEAKPDRVTFTHYPSLQLFRSPLLPVAATRPSYACETRSRAAATSAGLQKKITADGPHPSRLRATLPIRWARNAPGRPPCSSIRPRPTYFRP